VLRSFTGVTSATVSRILACGSLTFPGKCGNYSNPDLTPLEIFLWKFSKDNVYFTYFYLKLLLIFGQELQAQLQNSRQPRYVALGKKFIIGVVFAVLHLEVLETVTLIYQAKLDVSGYSSVYLFLFTGY
jgi:hypothetical protein